MEVTIIQALLIAAIYYVVSSGFWWFGILTFDTFWRPVVCGTIVGLVLGDPMQGMLIGASINLVYIGFVSVGNVIPSDPGLAGTVGTAIALAAGLDAASALVIAVPIATLGGLLDTFVRTVIFGFFSEKAADKARVGDVAGIYRFNVILAQAGMAIAYMTVAFLGCYLGAPAVSAVVDFIPEWFMTGIRVAGGLLPCIGFALLLQMISSKWTVAICFIGFVVAQYLGLPVLVIAVVFAIFAVAMVFGKESGNEDADVPEIPAAREMTLDKSIRRKVWLSWTFCAESGAGYIYYQGISMAQALSHAMKRWYTDKKELGDELNKHLCFYTTETAFGNPILGIMLAMEEERFLNKGTEQAPAPEAIIGIRSALMGPFASVGDSLRQGILLPILLSLCIGLAQSGSYLGPILHVVIWTAFILVASWVLFEYGYKWGKGAIIKLMGNGLMQKILTVSGIVSAGVVGAMISNYIGVTCGLSFTLMEATETAEAMVISVQNDLLDVIMAGIVPFGLTMGTFGMLKKGMSATKALLVLFAVGFVLGVLGILA